MGGWTIYLHEWLKFVANVGEYSDEVQQQNPLKYGGFLLGLGQFFRGKLLNFGRVPT